MEYEAKTEKQNGLKIEWWTNKYSISHFQSRLLKHGLQSLEDCISFAKTANITQAIKLLLTQEADDNDASFSTVTILEHAFNSLLKLESTNVFLSKLNELSQLETKQKSECEWTLVLIDCDDTESLIQEQNITLDNVENSINLLESSIYRLIENTKNEMFGYHLGGDLFGLFINDNCKMDKSKKIVENLIKIMQNKEKSSLTISVGIGIQRLSNVYVDDFKQLQREWVLRAHTNLLRAKENGKNCYFYHLEKIDPSKNNEELTRLAIQMDNLYQNCYSEECEKLYYKILSQFDENTMRSQAITIDTPLSIHFQMGRVIFSGKHDIGNEKYRGYAARKQFKKIVETFIIGKMSLECYYLYKSWECDCIRAIDYDYVAMKIKKARQAMNSNMYNEYDITLLTRKKTADPVILPVIKNTAMYWNKLAWEHINTNVNINLNTSSPSSSSCTPAVSSIILGFVYEVGRISKAFDYYEKLCLEMIESIDPKNALIRCHLAKRYYDVSLHTKAFDLYEKTIIDIPNNSKVLSNIMYHYSESLKLGTTRWQDCKYNRTERAQRALNYGKELIKLGLQGKYVRKSRYGLYANLLCNWSQNFENDEKQQKLALSMFEKAIRLDQNLGWDVINNWTRGYITSHRFESRLKDIIIQYWYLANEHQHILSDVLDCADLIETYFSDKVERMKQAKILSNSVPIDANVSMYMKTDFKSGKRGKYYVSVRKPAKCMKKTILDYKGLNFSDYGVVLAWWYMDRGGAINANPNNLATPLPGDKKFCKEYAAKLAYFCTFMFDSMSTLKSIDLSLPNVKNEFEILIIKLLVHYCWKLNKKTHDNMRLMIQDSNIMTRMVRQFERICATKDEAYTMARIQRICEKIESMVDLNNQDSILKMVDIIDPKIEFTKGEYESVSSINGCDVSCLFKDPFDLGQEIKICNVTLNGMGNAYNENYRFSRWDFNPQYNCFESAMACCIVQMFYQISKPKKQSL